MKSTKVITLIIFFVFGWISPKAMAFNPKQDILYPQRFPALKQLVQGSDLIGWGDVNEVTNRFSTPISVSHGKLVNTVQLFRVKQAFKGTKTSINLLVTGVEPLPRPRDPLNEIYPGPLASGSYILFLKNISGTNYYQLSGGWQGVYPILNQKSVALYGIGFKDLDQLTVSQFLQKLSPILLPPHQS
jgi:hypothetical protein